ncbi:hypothetical protein EDD15DRAFT_1106449 [Pisolithus albus]|nr:hypothetical protein EDD15DRAFT_1106449 [Pisolithus albus]
MLQPAGSPIPLICISPASPEKPQPAPCSPIPEVDNDGFRAKHLSPPPNISPSYPSSLRRSACFVPKGLSREQLDVLLKVSRERKAIPGGQKAPDLRKELAVKNQKRKQLGRRALFLSKVAEPTLPTAITIPKTPPESRALLHCSLPSPGLESPRAVSASVSSDTCGELLSHGGWVEQIDFRISIGKQCSAGRAGCTEVKASVRPGKFAPSLDEITACMSSPELDVGRLHMPLRELSPGVPFADGLERCIVQSPPSALLTPALQVTTIFVPRTVRATPFPLSESNHKAFSRSYTARDMTRMLKRRNLSLPPPLRENATSQRGRSIVFFREGRF